MANSNLAYLFRIYFLFVLFPIFIYPVANEKNDPRKEKPNEQEAHVPHPVTEKVSAGLPGDTQNYPLAESLKPGNFFGNDSELYNALNHAGFLSFNKNDFSGSFGLIIHTSGVYIKDTDLYSNSDFIDKQLILSGFLDLVFKVKYQTWLETIILIHNAHYMGSTDENIHYLQSSQPYLAAQPQDIYINLFYLKFNILTSGFVSRDDRFFLALGRQFLCDIYRIRNIFLNYIYPDKIDGALLQFNGDKAGKFNFLLFDIMNLYENWLKQPFKYDRLQNNSSDIIGNYNGDILSFRSGIFYESINLLPDEKKGKLFIYLNTLFNRYGPVISGADRTQKSGDFTDNDYLFHYGAGVLFQTGSLSSFLEFCHSGGIDRKLPGIMGNSNDITANGNFFRAGISLTLPRIKSTAQILNINAMLADGPSYNIYGNRKNYGFVTSGNHDFGGFLLNNIWGFRPFSLSLNNGFVHNTSYGFYHCSGAMTFNLDYAVFLNDLFSIDLQTWVVVDTSLYENSQSIFTKTDTFQNFKNRYVGNENMLTFLFSLNTIVRLYLSFDIFIPGELYQYFNHGIFSEKSDAFYGTSAGMQISF